jgi:hypothetical protein
VYDPKYGGGGVAGSQPMSTAVHRSPKQLWRSNSIFNLCLQIFLPVAARDAGEAGGLPAAAHPGGAGGSQHLTVPSC